MFSSLFGAACSSSRADVKNFPDPATDLPVAADAGPQTLVLAGGCFWCTEGVFEYIPGVTDVVSGYAGGKESMANYDDVSNGNSGHAEVIQITYDPSKTSMGKLLKAFFSVAHDPTTLNRQGPDSGTQYRSAIFFANEDQKRVAAAYMKQLDDAKVFDAKIVTTLEPLTKFHVAEKYHQDYARLNPGQPYIVQQALGKITKAKKFAAAQPATQPTTRPAE